MSQLSLTEGNVRRALSRFAIPFLGASLLQFLYGAVDLIVLGHGGTLLFVSYPDSIARPRRKDNL